MYPVCIVADEVTCLTGLDAWYFCAEAPGDQPGGLFTDFPAPLRFIGYKDCGGDWCVVVTGRADRKEIARDASGAAVATGLVSDSGEFRDGMEQMDNNNPSTCTFARVL